MSTLSAFAIFSSVESFGSWRAVSRRARKPRESPSPITWVNGRGCVRCTADRLAARGTSPPLPPRPLTPGPRPAPGLWLRGRALLLLPRKNASTPLDPVQQDPRPTDAAATAAVGALDGLPVRLARARRNARTGRQRARI